MGFVGAEPVCVSRKMRSQSASVHLCVSAASRIRDDPVDPNSISSLVQTIFAAFATFLLAAIRCSGSSQPLP
jgi:hypothetical protein